MRDSWLDCSSRQAILLFFSTIPQPLKGADEGARGGEEGSHRMEGQKILTVNSQPDLVVVLT
jgi:hypothetical protein